MGRTNEKYFYKEYQARKELLNARYHKLDADQKLYINGLTSLLITEREAQALAAHLEVLRTHDHQKRPNTNAVKLAWNKASTKAAVLAKHVDDLHDRLNMEQRQTVALKKLNARLLKRRPIELRIMLEIIDHEFSVAQKKVSLTN